MVRVGDTVYDASVSSRLVRFRQEAVERAVQTIKEGLQRFEIAE